MKAVGVAVFSDGAPDPQWLCFRRFLEAAGAYALGAALIGWGVWQGHFVFSVLAAYAMLALAVNSVLLATFVSGLNRRFADPSLTGAQVLAGGLIVLYVAHFAGALRPLVMIWLILVFSFALLGAGRLGVPGLLAVSGLLVGAHAVSLFWLRVRDPLGFDVPRETFQWGAVAATLACMSVIAGSAADLRAPRRESSARFRDFGLVSGDLFWETDASGRLRWVGGASEALLGVTAKAAVGRRVQDFADAGCARSREGFERYLAASRQGKPFRGLWFRVAATGRWLSTNGMPATAHAQGGGYRGTCTDVSDLWAAETALRESERELRLVLESVPALIAYFDADLELSYCNDAFARVFANDGVDPRGRAAVNISGMEDFRPFEEARLRRALAGEHVSFERAAGAGSAGPHYAVVLVPDRPSGGAVRGLYSVMVDVTELRALDRAKGDFLSTASHELRTPLAAINGALGLLAGPLHAELPDRALALVTTALRSGDALARLVDDILDIDKLEGGKLRIVPARLDLERLAAEAIERAQELALAQGVRLELIAEREALALGDRDRLHQVLGNLLSNALKHSPAGATVHVSVRTETGRARVSVRDHGPGVPAELRARLFGRFEQAERPLTRRGKGAGLGLAISKGIVELHGGAIGYEEANGGGALFWFDLPRAPGAGRIAAATRIGTRL